MSLNIKNQKVHEAAAELARLRNVSLTQAVLDAVLHELDREKKSRRKTKLSDELLEIGRRCAAHMRRPVSSADHASMLYDDEGLPR